MTTNAKEKGAGMAKMSLVRKPVQRVGVGEVEGLRDGSTGMALPQLSRVWAVAEVEPRSGLALVPQPVPAAGSTRSAITEAPFEVAFYRKYTEGMLRRYAKMRMEAGRVPSMMGREMFRGKVTHYRVNGLDDVVIFCRDMETRLERLQGLDRQLILRIAMQGYTYSEVAGMVGVSLRTVVRKYAMALDRLTRLLIEARLLEPQKVCQ